jgi:heme exporter protein B
VINSLLALIQKDVALEFRRKESVISMMMFGLLVMVIFNFAFEPASAERPLIAPGVLWVALTFAGVIGLNRSLAIDLDNDSLQGLLLAPLSRGTLYIGKVISNFLFMMLADTVIFLFFVVFYDLQVDSRLLWVALIAALGTLGFAAVGTILSMISSQTRMSEVMLPVLQIPLTIPLILAAVAATGAALSEEGEGFSAWVNLVIGFDIIFFVISYLVFDYVVEE